jgi:hypothetical protein
MCDDMTHSLEWMEALREFAINLSDQEMEEVASVEDFKGYMELKLCEILQKRRKQPAVLKEIT